MGALAWDGGACILKYACCVQLHQFACSSFCPLRWFPFRLAWGISLSFHFSFMDLVWPYFFSWFTFCIIILFKGINWCFVSYSFVSVKGPGRKLSLPTDLKTDLGTVGESQQFSHDFPWVIGFLLFVTISRLLCCFSFMHTQTFSFQCPCHVLLLVYQSIRLSGSSVCPCRPLMYFDLI